MVCPVATALQCPLLPLLASLLFFFFAPSAAHPLTTPTLSVSAPYTDPLFCTSPLECRDQNLKFRFELNFGV